MRKLLSYHYAYPHPSVTTDCVVFGFDGQCLNVLLIQRGAPPFEGCWAFPGGFLNIDEAAHDGALRELYEETGLRATHIYQFHTFTDPKRDPRERVITIAYYTLVTVSEVKGGDDAAQARWFRINDIPTLAFDHNQMLMMALQALRRQSRWEPLGRNLLPERFRMEQLQQLYEAIFDEKLDADNFARTMEASRFVIKVQSKQSETNDEGPLFTFNTENDFESRQTVFGRLLEAND